MKERTFNILLLLSAPIIAGVFVVSALLLLDRYVLHDCPYIFKVHQKDKP